MDETQSIQHREYEFPYHYLVRYKGGHFNSYRNWNWALQYVTALSMISDRVNQISPNTLVDIGCGDGALVKHLSEMFPHIQVCGIDYDERAITSAKAMSPHSDYQRRDIINDPIDAQYDCATMIEVFEHIPPDDGAKFLASAKRLLKPGAPLIMTVPHQFKKVIPKHYRHFSIASLRECVEPFFEVQEIFAFERPTRASKLAKRLATIRGAFIEIDALNKYVLKQQIEMRSQSDTGYLRIFACLVSKG